MAGKTAVVSERLPGSVCYQSKADYKISYKNNTGQISAAKSPLCGRMTLSIPAGHRFPGILIAEIKKMIYLG